MSNYHVSVLLQESLNLLQISPNEKYIDATYGGGGHTSEILNKGGTVLALDWDEDAHKNARETIETFKKNLILIRSNFRDIKKVAEENDFTNVSGILFDLGISSHHIDAGERGFSFQQSGPLDMRMDTRLGVTAKDLIQVLSKKDLIEMFVKLGEENNAYKIATTIVKKRDKNPIETTEDLAKILKIAYGVRSDISGKRLSEVSKRVFQALRIAVNDELHNIEEALPDALDLLKKGGRIVVISFHSLEDRIVKQTFKDFEQKGLGTILTKDIVVPSSLEQEENPRSRSAKLRAFEKI